MIIVAAAVLSALLCLLVPGLVRILPEPTPRPVEEGQDPEPPKVLYADLAARPGLRSWSVVTGLAAGALLAAALEGDWWLWVWVALVPVGVALGYIDWHTRLLPTRLVVPATLAVIVAGMAGWAVTGSADNLIRAAICLVVARSIFYVAWFVHSAGMGFGDVRLAALLGFALGHLGWGEFMAGLYVPFLIFGLPGVLLALVKWDRALLKTAFPFGPFMLVGALIGVLIGAWTYDHLIGN